jgi:DeoR/GlpR family transcriptional regulator of sugar metabolism
MPSPATTDPDFAPLIPDQRREAILKQLRRDKVLSVQQLMALLNCSHMTVRRDIAALEEAGLVFTVQGGVRIANSQVREPSHASKTALEQPQKQAIARAAAGILRAGMTIYLDAGTTMLAMTPHVVSLEDMTVITNDFEIVRDLARAPHVEVIHTGGQLDHANRSSVGPLAASTLRQVALDVAFISASSWDLRRGVTTPSAPKVEVKTAAMQAASRSVLAVSSFKFGTFGLYKVASLDRFDHIITDDGLADAAAQGIRQSGVELELAPVA